MPNATVRANARTMPIDRRAALGSLATATVALLALPPAAEATDLDADLLALATAIEDADRDLAVAVERVTAAVRAERQAGVRLSALENVPGQDTPEIDEAQAAYDSAANALDEAQDLLLEAKPRTIAGVRTMLATLLNTDALSDWPVAATLARTMLDAPALGGEA